MSIASNVTRRAGSARYYARVAVPLDLRDRLKKRELWKSLGTTDPAEAKRLARQQLVAWDREFEELRRRRELTETDLQEAVWQRYVELVEADERFRQSLPTDDDLDEIWRHLEAEFGDYDLQAYGVFRIIRDRFEEDRRDRQARLTSLREHAARGETKLVAEATAKEIETRRLDLAKGSSGYRKLAQGLQRAELEALARGAERDAGDFTGEPHDKLVKPPAPRTSTKAGVSILELFDAYARENPDGVKQDTLNQSRMAVALFADSVGTRFPVADIDKKAVREWKQLLLQYPVKATETREFRSLSLKKVVERNATLGKPTISPRTVNRYLSGLGAFCDWLVAHDYLKQNPLPGMYLHVDKAKRSTLPFPVDHMNMLFATPLFTGCQSDDRWHLPGGHKVRDHRYWLPLVMLFTGARPGEIAQLLTDDVRELHGQWIMHVTTEGDATKSVKTRGSMRVIPVHPELKRLGFLDHCAAMRARGEKRLFPEAERNARGQIAAMFSREFGRYLTRIGLKDGRGLSLYSFRHGVVDALRRAEFLDDQFGFLVGHTKPSTTGQYGVLPQGMLRQRVQMIEAIAYPGLDLSHLYSGADQK